MENIGPRLLETTMSGDRRRTFAPGLGLSTKDLTREELELCYESERYSHQRDLIRWRDSINEHLKFIRMLREVYATAPDGRSAAISYIDDWLGE